MQLVQRKQRTIGSTKAHAAKDERKGGPLQAAGFEIHGKNKELHGTGVHY
jgi:hypothetical protein